MIPMDYVALVREQGWCGGKNTRLPPMWHGFNSNPVPYSGFPPSAKTLVSKLQFEQDRRPTWKPAKTDVAFSLSIVIFYIHLLFARIADLWYLMKVEPQDSGIRTCMRLGIRRGTLGF